ncbi:MAG: hypothetical protein AAGA48_11605 [Myxococcota bacterium]
MDEAVGGAMAHRLAGLAVAGGLVNLVCDVALAPGWGPGSAAPDPSSAAILLGQVPIWRVVGATVVGAIAISSWTLATPALARLVRPAGPSLTFAVSVLHVWFVGGCVTFHVLFGSTVWAADADPSQVEPMWMAMGAVMGMLFLSLLGTLGAAVFRSPDVPRWLPFASPVVGMTVLPGLAGFIPAPVGLPLTLSASTAGAVVWLVALWRTAQPSPTS